MKKRHKSNLLLFVLSFLFSAVVFAAVAGLYFLWGQPATKTGNTFSEPTQKAEYTSKDGVNILLAGLSDNRHAAFFALLRIDPAGKRVLVLALPPQTQANTPDLGKRTLAGFYDYGGINYPLAATESLLNIEINYYMVLSLAGTEQIIDLLGGVVYEVPRDFTCDPSGGSPLTHLKKGIQSLSGAQVTALLNCPSWQEDEAGRITALSDILCALLNQSLLPVNLTNNKDVVAGALNHTQNNISVVDLPTLTEKLQAVAAQNTGAAAQKITLPGKYKTGEDGTVVFEPSNDLSVCTREFVP